MAQHGTYAELVLAVDALPGRRVLVGIAGPPASGKSTVAERLARDLARPAIVVPMDGFHLDDAILDARGHRARKGAPHTFDVAGFSHLLHRLAQSNAEAFFPVFDRSIELSRAAAGLVISDIEIVVVEGNYLLLQQDGWSGLRRHFALTVMCDVSEAVLRERLSARWAGLDEEEARAKIEHNDLPNARLIRDNSAPADFVLDIA